MNLIDDNINIQNMYKYQISEKESDEYEKYIKYLTIFFQKEVKKEKYTKEYLDGKYILVDKNDPKKKIIITPSQFINIHKLYLELKKYSELILFKISNIVESKNNITDENRDEFEDLKKKYLSFKQQINDIDLININFYNEIEELLNKQIEKSYELAKYYQKRTLYYKSIEIMIKEPLKNKLIKIFKNKNKKIPGISEINKIAKENSIPSKEIEKWFSWIESVYFYRLVKDELLEINKIIEKKEYNFENNTNYMIIKKPVIKE